MTRSSPTLTSDAGLPTNEAKIETFTADTAGYVRPRAVLLNPPCTQTCFRDYFCTLVSKADYYYHPVDLVYLSGILDREGYYLECIDAIAEGLTPAETSQRIEAFRPQYVFYLTSSPSYDEDTAFLTELKRQLPHATFVGSGDIYRETREHAFVLHPFCDAILTDFSTTDLVDWLKRTDDTTFSNILYRARDGRIVAGPERHGYGFYRTMPIPRWDLWPLDRYSFPFARKRRWATVLTDFGCPYSCTFCPMSTVGYKLRDIDTVMDELRMLHALGVDEIFFRDQTFGVNRARTTELLRRIREEFPTLSWTCWSRVDVVNDEFLSLIAASGCHTIMVGIETANEDILRRYKKNTKRTQMESSLALARRHGLTTVGTIIVGLPGESEASIRDTVRFACSLPLDFASINIATPRFGSTFRRLMRERNALDHTVIHLDSSHVAPAWRDQDSDETLAPTTVERLHREAVRTFYLRPSYLLRRLLSIRSFWQLRQQIANAWSLLRRR